MIKHIVIWTLKETAARTSREDNKLTFKKMLLALKGVVPSLVDIEVGVKGSLSPENNDDIVLVSTFKSWDDLQAYQVHPEHQKVVAFAKEVVEKRSAIDYEF